MIREAAERLLAAAPDAAGSCLAMASDLIGCVDGPTDLSHGKKHMRGFGR